MKGCPGGSHSKEPACSARDTGSIPGSGKSPGEGNGHPLQCSFPENPWIEETGCLQSLRCKDLDMTGWLTLSYFLVFSSMIRICTKAGLSRWLSGKESTCQCRRQVDKSSIPGLGRSPGKDMATYSSILALKIPWTEEPGGQ